MSELKPIFGPEYSQLFRQSGKSWQAGGTETDGGCNQNKQMS